MQGIKIIEEAVRFLSSVDFYVLPTKQVTKAKGSTPNVTNIEKVILVNTVATNVTNFVGGQDGQSIDVLGDGYSTLVYDTTKLYTNTAANKLLAANKIYRLTRLNSKWYEDA